jgi:hypothetical protein
MRCFTVIFLICCFERATAQNKLAGSYRNPFGSNIQINPNNTFYYTWNFDMQGSWTRGTWTSVNDTVFFKMIPIYDTLQKTNNNSSFDSLILSVDSVPERLIPGPASAVHYLSSGGQSIHPYPEKLFFKKERLYEVKGGKLQRKKLKAFWINKKYNPWYFKKP